MTRIKMLGLMVGAVFALSAVAASTASAVQWLNNGAAITSALLVLSTGTLLLQDLSTGAAVICKGDNHGTVGPGAVDLTLSVISLGCVFDTGKTGPCEAGVTPSAAAVHLPWITRLLTVAGATRDMIEETPGKGAPGWEVKCKVPIFGIVTDTCTSATEGDPKITNDATDVLETFEATEKASCSEGTATSGMVIGTTLIFAENRASNILSTG
jgi:hypothetical protein